jgi:hypothetical protein
LRASAATSARASERGLIINIGHDLNLENLPLLTSALPAVAEASIGHELTDTYGFYQARNIRQTAYQIAVEQLDAQLLGLPDMPEAARTKIEDRIKRFRERVDRYESDPSTGDGKKELLAKAKEFEARRDQAAERDPNFDFAEALFQIAIVLGSVSIVAASRPLVHLSGILAIAGTLLMINGYFLLVHLPLE